MTTISTIYTGELRTRAVHLQSGSAIITDAPTDNQGKGEAFSPTDLLAASLGSCILTIIGISAREHGFNIDGTRVDITKVMASNPRRVCEIILEFTFPAGDYSPKHKRIIEAAVRNCPVAQSIHPEIIRTIKYNF